MTKEQIKDYGVKITQANRTGLVVISYDIAIGYINSALEYYKEQDVASFRQEIKKAKAILNELTSALDMQYEISHILFKIYMFMSNHLMKCQIRAEATELNRIVGMLMQLREAFYEISATDTSEPVMENTQQVYAGLTYSKGSLNESMYTEQNRGFTV